MIKIIQKNLLFIISGPTGSGKTTICNKMLNVYSDQCSRIITATTREPREGERNGSHYYFFTHQEFKLKILEKAFYEYAFVYGNYYGIMKKDIYYNLNFKKKDLLLNIDIKGASTIKNKIKKDTFFNNHLISIFIMPSNIEEIKKRLINRNKNDNENIKKRLEIAKIEMASWKSYNYCIKSSTKEMDFEILKSIYLAEKSKIR